jgi:nucleosome binding factor SPN SPT16 subunit
MSEVTIDSKTFQDRLSLLASAWKADSRSASPVFHGAASMIIMCGKLEEQAEYQKNTAMHVSWLSKAPRRLTADRQTTD